MKGNQVLAERRSAGSGLVHLPAIIYLWSSEGKERQREDRKKRQLAKVRCQKSTQDSSECGKGGGLKQKETDQRGTDERQEVDKGGWWDERWSQSVKGVSFTRNNQCHWRKCACQNAKTPQDSIYAVTSIPQCFCWGTEMQNRMEKKKKWWKLHKTLVPTERSKLMSLKPAPAKYYNYEVGIPDNTHPPPLHNRQRFTADVQNHKSSSCPLSHTCRLTQASQSAVCPADADWWRAVVTRHMRGSSIKDGPGQPETGSYLQRNNTETTELPPSIINQEHVETLCVCVCVLHGRQPRSYLVESTLVYMKYC